MSTVKYYGLAGYPQMIFMESLKAITPVQTDPLFGNDKSGLMRHYFHTDRYGITDKKSPQGCGHKCLLHRGRL
ncbi:hypothetical protein ABMA09_26035 (plasmid) [Erwinia rhapontici]